MDDNSKENRLDSEIEKRLADLFGEEDTSVTDESPVEEKDTVEEENKPQEEQVSAEDEDIFDLTEVATDERVSEGDTDDYPLAELKNLVLSIDWEITDEALADFLAQIDSLKVTYKNEKIILTFLQLLGSLGVYIKTNRGNAHPKTFKILNSVFSSLEKVVRSAKMTVAEKKKLLHTEMNKYTQLRNQVSKKKAEKVSRKKIISAPKELESLIKAPRQKEAVMPGRNISEKAASKNRELDSATRQSIANLAEAVEELKKFIHSELNALKKELRILHKSK
ncbi:MAG: hypothetical protein P8185_08650 [Deltaproteobacteria bacterium]